MEAGEIGFAHLMVMARTAQALRRSFTTTPFDEKVILDKARESTVGRLYYDCQHLRHAQDPQGYAAGEVEAVEARRLEIKAGGNGFVSLKGFLDSAGRRRCARRWSRWPGRRAPRTSGSVSAGWRMPWSSWPPGPGRPSSKSLPRSRP